MFHLQHPPADVEKRDPSEVVIKKLIETKTHLIAKKSDEFEIRKGLFPFEKDTNAVIKIISRGIDNRDIKREMEHWAATGYLLAYASQGKSATYLILMVNVGPPVDEHWQKQEQKCMVNAMGESRSMSGVE